MKRTTQKINYRYGRYVRFVCGLMFLGSILIVSPGYGQGRGKPDRSTPRHSMGNVGAMGARPMTRPQPQAPVRQTPPASRPQRPDFANQKPSFSTVKPSFGNSKPANFPSATKPNINIPSVRPGGSGGSGGSGNTTRPSRPSTLPTKPSLPSLGNDRPSIGMGQPSNKLPNLSGPGGSSITRPETRPQRPDRPTTRPETRPQRPDRPTTRPNIPGDNTKPTIKPPSLGQVRPKPLPFPLPDAGGVGVTRPGNVKPSRPANPSIPGVNRPGAGRPGIGGAVTLPGVVGGNQININNNIWNNNSINNNFNRPFWDRPQWDNGWGGNGWGASWGVYPGNTWHQSWYSHCVHPHYHTWYNGCWSGYWGSSWYAPVVWGGIGWGLNNVYQSNNTVYVNPYYVPIATTSPSSVVFDYSQPISVNNYQTSDAPQSNPIPRDREADALQRFDEALEAFQSGNYALANQSIKEAIRLNGGDPVTHEIYALTLFSLGDYEAAAATLNALLASAPGMDWTSLSSLYGDIGDYTTQLRRLEDFCEQRPGNASAEFVLAYHYLVLGEKEAATKSLQIVVEKQPKDLTARRMLEGLQPPKSTSPRAAPPQELGESSAEELPQVDLVGKWRAVKGNSLVELTITEEASFTWVASSDGKQNARLDGTITTSPDGIVLETSTNGTLAGRVRPSDDGNWTFYPPGSPVEEGLLFQKQN